MINAILPEEIKHRLRMIDAHTMPTNDDDLHQYIKSYLNFHIPRVSICKEHVAPFNAVADAFFERETNIIILANRSGGKTRNLSILNHLNSIHKSLFEIAHIGAIREQAHKGGSYLREYGDIEWFSQDIVFSISRETKYRNGSIVQILSGTTSGVNSPHPLMMVIDEVELISWTDVLQEAFSCAQSKRGYKAVQILASTRKYASGNMYRLLVEKPKEPSWPYKIYPWCLWEVLKRCDLLSCGQCKKVIRIKGDGEPESWFDICHDDPERHPLGKAKSSDGFYELDDAWVKFATLDEDIFNSQWLCLRPGRKGLVFPSFDRLVHSNSDLVEEWRGRLMFDRFERPVMGRNAKGEWVEIIPRELEIAVLMDMGWADPLAVLFIAKDQRDNLFYFDSIYKSELDLRDLVPMITERFDKYNLPYDLANRFDEDGKPRTFEIRCDERAPREIDELNGLGLYVTPIGLAPDERMRLLRKWLDGNYREGYPGICVDPDTCEPLCVELETLKLKLDKDGNPRSEMPEKGPNHLIDCAGYGFNALGLDGGGFDIQILRYKESPFNRPKPPTRSDWAERRRL